ncbi:two-partner secretion domain-containing protein [Thiorhodovibrio litoralis]|uniref:two-partner secretion domain-containing protein n=1 Tax=Thiorhodovibrio litoralis TaxID=2952932 RepID=UPI002B256DE2|nr:filamentous hemagglutinin N-terminal domain-containing protein [Thiorhodovibrio litoralis]WPL11291.1 hypothetical protein Thiosp_01024 [Thiorhodovibrio litoralis]
MASFLRQLRPACLTVLFLSITTALARADIATDGSMGPRLDLKGPDMQIGAELGKTHGNNLFHSFQQFNIPTDQSATFTGPDNIQNVIGRVTGGQASNIDGALRSEVGQADVFLINPSGVVMGPNATVDVPASLHVSTADELRFQDGSRFSASEPGASTLTMAAPEAFGFLGQQPAANLHLNGSQLQVQPSETLSLSAGDIGIQGSGEQLASLAAPGGTLRLEALGATATAVLIDPPAPPADPSLAPGLPHLGQLAIADADLDTSGDGGGLIVLKAGQASLTNALLIAENQGERDATGGISANFGGAFEILGSWLYTDTAAGRGGQVWVRAGQMYLDNGAQIASDAYAEGDAGSVKLVVADLLEVLNGAVISSSTFAEGNAGGLDIAAGAARLDDGGLEGQFTGLLSSAQPDSSGDAGSVKLVVADLLEVLNGAKISSDTFAEGNAGSLDIAAGAARLDGGGLELFTGLTSSAQPDSSGDAGSVKLVVADLLEVLKGAEISSSTFAEGNAGGLDIAAGAARLDDGGLDLFTGLTSSAESDSSGDAGSVKLVVADLLEVLNGAQISSSTFAEGNAGSLDIAAGAACLDGGGLGLSTGLASSAQPGSSGDAGSVKLVVADLLEVLNGAVIFSGTFAEGNAGSLDIAAGAARLDGGGLEGQFTVLASGANRNSSGDAGSVKLVIADLLEVLNGAQISSSTFAEGNAGSLDIAAGAARLDGGGLELFTGLTSSAQPDSSGDAGSVKLVVADLLEVLNGAEISSGTFAGGNAGSLDIAAGAARLDGGGLELFTGLSSSAQPDSSGDAGSVKLVVADLLEVLNGAVIFSSTFAEGNAGSVNVSAEGIMMSNGGFFSEATREATGQVGNVAVNALNLSLREGSLISIESRNPSASAPLMLDVSASETRRIQVNAGHLELNDSEISATSTGQMPAATMAIDADTMQLANDSRISTESLAADAGPILIAGGFLWLKDSQITTSAEGLLGNGGDIDLAPKQLILDGGFIQANTAAADASGGDIRIGAQALIASYDQIEIGGNERQVFIPGSGQNVIQAAAPMGVQGDIAMATPDFDITATLVPLRTPFEDRNALLSDQCQIGSIEEASALVALGTGGLPPGPEAPLATPVDSERLKRLLLLED